MALFAGTFHLEPLCLPFVGLTESVATSYQPVPLCLQVHCVSGDDGDKWIKLQTQHPSLLMSVSNSQLPRTSIIQPVEGSTSTIGCDSPLSCWRPSSRQLCGGAESTCPSSECLLLMPTSWLRLAKALVGSCVLTSSCRSLMNSLTTSSIDVLPGRGMIVVHPVMTTLNPAPVIWRHASNSVQQHP
jgi:hypothetical protein